MDPALIRDIFQIRNSDTFRELALKVFHYQAARNEVYREFLQALGRDLSRIREPEEIPFLPVEFFKTHRIQCGAKEPGLVFESSGTSQMTPALHYVPDIALYRRSFTEGFRRFYGDPEQYCILALLPSYLERKSSSLIYMMDHLIRLSSHPESGFYLRNLDELEATLQKRNRDGHPTLLLGVSFALLELAEKYPMELTGNITVMDTGGMKGKRKELVRSELHFLLQQAFGVASVHSEYGMTELLSQAYSKCEGMFETPPWMRVLVRDANDPLTLLGPNQAGGLNIIDLANLYSCAFIATGDLGKLHEDGRFEVLGRFDHADVRGCNLLVT
jgi:phenylacetate-coenzyme A ligase PaaK-like adenylate-forming protein